MSDHTRTTSSHVTEGLVAPMPTHRTIFLRTFIPWQMIRFVVINLKMFRLIWRRH